MSTDTLGSLFDIHGGGIDLTFPHQENEIAQSRCANGMVPARYWMHNGHLTVGGQKMSKSLGNFVTLEDLVKRWPGEAIRVALLSAQYRQPLNVTEKLLADAKARLDYIYGVLRRKPAGESHKGNIPASLFAALEDDLNTPLALSLLQELAGSVEAGQAEANDLREAGALLGLLQENPESWFRWQPAEVVGMAESEIQKMIEARNAARAKRDFAGADRIREQLLQAGIALSDVQGGTIWKRVWL
jgi:cysteinyl-tRNA synthetase